MTNTSLTGSSREPCFSVIVPVFNAAAYLTDCLDSLLGQTETDWECLCVDDGSTDASGAILDNYAARDNRFHVIHQDNAGEGPSRNRALDAVRGRHVVFLDSDDILEPRTLSVHRKAWERIPEADCSLIGLIRFKETEKPTFSNPTNVEIVVRDIAESYCRPLNERYFVQYAYSSALLRGIRFPSLSCGADGVFLGHALDRASLVVESDFTGYGYRERNTSASGLTVLPPRHFLGWLEQDMTLLAIMSTSSKHFGPAAYHGLYDGLTQYLAAVFFRRLDENGRKEVFNRWMQAFGAAANDHGFSIMERIRLRFLAWIKKRFFVRLFCDWRHWCRTHGLRKPRTRFFRQTNDG